MTENTELARRLYEAWNERNFDEMADAMAPEGKITIVNSGQTFDGPEGARRYGKMWADGFPDGRCTVDRVLGSGDHVIIEFTGVGTHTGTLATAMGDLPATGRSMTMQLCDVTEFRDGKVVNQRSYLDTGSLMAQLGVSADLPAATRQQ